MNRIHENNLQEIDRHNVYEQCRKVINKPFGRKADILDVSVYCHIMQRTPGKINPKKNWIPPIKLNPRKLYRKLRKAA